MYVVPPSEASVRPLNFTHIFFVKCTCILPMLQLLAAIPSDPRAVHCLHLLGKDRVK